MEKNENIFNTVVDEMKNRRGLMVDELKTRFSKVKPFRKEEASDDELLYHYDIMNNDPNRDMYIQTMMQRKGDVAVNQFIMRMELLKQKRGTR